MSSERERLLALLPEGLGAAVEQATGREIVGVRPRGGGGASRSGAEIELAQVDGVQRCYMNYDVYRAGAGDDAAFEREVAILRALSGPLRDSGVRVAPFVAAIPELRTLIGGYVPGEADYNKLATPEARLAVAQDYLAQLALLHRIDVAEHPVEGMGPVQPIREEIAERIAKLRAINSGDVWDPLIHMALDWLESNVPADFPAPTIVHGDAGPANFLYDDGRVTGLLDWELVHYGDPMADLAMLRLRMLFQPFVPIPDVFRFYREAGGHPIDRERLRYWQILFHASFARRERYDRMDAPPPPNLGMNLVFTLLHRRVLAEMIADALMITVERVVLPEVPPGPRQRAFAVALDDLRHTIGPRLGDQQSSAKAKGLVRLIKWWRDLERYEPALHAREHERIEAVLGESFADYDEAWRHFEQALASGRIGTTPALAIVHRRVASEAAVYGTAMGSLAEASPPPLD